MKVEKLERVALTVKNLDEAIRLFSDLLGTTFERNPAATFVKNVTEHADRAFEETRLRVAISPIGLELIETIPPTEKEGVRSFHFKVSDLDQAKAEMKEKGIRLLAEIAYGGLKEAIFSPSDLHGGRLCLTEFEAPTAIDAILQR